MNQHPKACRRCTNELIHDKQTYASALLTTNLARSIEMMEMEGICVPFATITCMHCGHVSSLSYEMHKDSCAWPYEDAHEYYTSVLALCCTEMQK